MPLVSFAIAAYNRRDVLLRTLAQLHSCGLAREEFEILVVDNASSDGSADAIRAHFPDISLIESRMNRGSCAKNEALRIACGSYIVFIDDDSYPTGDSIPRMIAHFNHHPRLGAAGFTVTLPDGSRECSAYPDVFIGCGVGFRRAALAEVGGLPDDYFIQAEEYDLSLRLLNAGWDVRTFDDLHVSHLKTPAARMPSRTIRLDVRNNLTLIFRRFPDRWVTPFARDWIKRYAMIAATKGHRLPHACGVIQGLARSCSSARREPVSEGTFEQFARLNTIEDLLRDAQREHGLKRILLADLGKNMLPYWLAARRCGIDVAAIADNKLGGWGWKYRGSPIMTDEQALGRDRTHPHPNPLPGGEGARRGFDAVVISNLSPVHARNRLAEWRRFCPDRPVIDLFESQRRDAWSCGQRLSAAIEQSEQPLAA